MSKNYIIESQKQVASSVIAKLRAIDPYAIVAGGAPRDWYFDKPATDVDIFLHIPSKRPLWAIKRQFKAIGLKVESVKNGDNLPVNYKLNPELRTVFNISGYDTPVQVMVMNFSTFDSVVPKFALSIVKAWWTPEEGTKLHSDFLLTLKTGVIFKCSELYNNEHSYLQKVISKFPEYKYANSREAALEIFVKEN